MNNSRRFKKNHSLTFYVVFSISILLIYTAIELILTARFNVSGHDTLTTCVYAAFGGEILSCALIKIFKLRGGSNDELAN